MPKDNPSPRHSIGRDNYMDPVGFNFLSEQTALRKLKPNIEVVRYVGTHYGLVPKSKKTTVKRGGLNGKSIGVKTTYHAKGLQYKHEEVTKDFCGGSIDTPIKIKQVDADAIEMLDLQGDETLHMAIEELATVHKPPTEKECPALHKIADDFGIEKYISITKNRGVRRKMAGICGVGVSEFLFKAALAAKCGSNTPTEEDRKNVMAFIMSEAGISEEMTESDRAIIYREWSRLRGVLCQDDLLGYTGKKLLSKKFVSRENLCPPDEAVKQGFSCGQVFKTLEGTEFFNTLGIPKEFQRVCPNKIAALPKNCKNQAYVYQVENGDMLLC